MNSSMSVENVRTPHGRETGMSRHCANTDSRPSYTPLFIYKLSLLEGCLQHKERFRVYTVNSNLDLSLFYCANLLQKFLLLPAEETGLAN